MADEEKDQKVEELTARIQALTATVEELSSRLSSPPAKTDSNLSPAKTDLFDEEEVGSISEFTEDVLEWAGKAALLQRTSTLCFLLVIALGLRTLTDNNIIATLPGSALGMGYASILMLAGWRLYSREIPLAPVFAACGAGLMSIIVVETHSRFQSLPLIPAYLTLMGTGIGMAAISYRFKVLAPISIGTSGICLAGAAIDYPHPYFPYLAMVLWTANVLAFVACRIRSTSWLRWIVFLVTVFMIHLWGVRLSMYQGGDPIMEKMGLSMFLPVLVVFAATFFTLALLGILSSRDDSPSWFDMAVPTLSGVWAYLLALMAARVLETEGVKFAMAGIVFSLVHFGTGWFLAERHPGHRYGATALLFAGISILAASLPVATGSMLFSLPVVSLTALAIYFVSLRWSSDGSRIVSYFSQLYATTALLLSFSGPNPPWGNLATVIPIAAVASCSFLHFRFARRYPPAANSRFFSKFDDKDRSAVLLLLASLVSIFLLLKITVYRLLLGTTGNFSHMFSCSQSIIINLGAAFLMLAAFHNKNREIRNVAILVTIIGGVRVFVFDLLSTHGIPLVASVFIFGLVAAMESIALGRWHRAKDNQS